MEVLKPGENVPPAFFITECSTVSGRGCRATLKVFPSDCFQTYVRPGDRLVLSFYCAQCGLVVTPDERLPEDHIHFQGEHGGKVKKFYLKSQPFKTKDNVPPWSPLQFPSWDEFDKKNGIKRGIF